MSIKDLIPVANHLPFSSYLFYDVIVHLMNVVEFEKQEIFGVQDVIHVTKIHSHWLYLHL